VQSRSRATVALLVSLLVGVSVAIRALLVFARPLWHDELFTSWAALLPLPDLLRALAADSGPPGFYLLEKPFALAAGGLAEGEWLLRAVSFAAALLLFGAAFTLPRGRARGFLLVLMSGSLLVNLYSAEARPYALLGLLCLALFLSTLRGAERAPRLLAVALLAAAALYTHYLALLAVGALVVLSALSRRWRSCAALAAGAAAWLPWAPVLMTQPSAAVAWMRETAGTSITGFLSALGGVGRTPAPFGPAPHPALFYGGLATSLVLVALLVALSRTDRDIRESTAFVLLVLTGSLVAGAWRPVAFAGRTEMAVLPVWLWAMALAAGGSRPARWLAGAAAALGLCASLGYVGAPQAEAAPLQVVRVIARVAHPQDTVVAAAAFYLPARLASERGSLAAAVRPLPEALARHPGWFIPPLPGADQVHLVARAAAQTPPGGRLFVLLPPEYATPDLLAALAAPGGRARELWRSADALVILRTRDQGSPIPGGS